MPLPSYEKLGAFYLGREIDPQSQQPGADPALRLARPDDPRGLRRHDRQRQDRPVPVAARGSRHRRRAGDRDRPQGRPRQPDADLPGSAARGLPAVGGCGRGRAQGPVRGGVRRGRPRRPGRRDWPNGTRTASASSASATPPTWRSTRRDRQSGLPLSILRSLRRHRMPRLLADSTALKRAHRRGRLRTARLARHRRRPAQEPRAHAALDHPRHRLAQGQRARTSLR